MSRLNDSTRSVLPAAEGSSVKRTLQNAFDERLEPGETKRIALVVGNANYERISKLANPTNDASDVCAELRGLQFEVLCMLDIQSRREFREAVRQFISKLGPRSMALFYYAGHGIQLNGENYLLPVMIDARSTADIEDEGLSLNYLLRSLESARSSPNIVVLDACRNNPFQRTGLASVARGLARVEPPVGTMLVYATAPNGVAMDGYGRNGLFTKHFLKRANEAGLKIDELFQVVAKYVQEEARGYGVEQVPFRSSSYSGAYCLAGCENPKVIAEIEQIKLQREEASKKIAALTEENDSLKRMAQERDSKIPELEKKISTMMKVEYISDYQKSSHQAELDKLQQALRVARLEKDESIGLRKAVAERELVIQDLKNKMSQLFKKAEDLEEYRRQINSLQTKSNETAIRVQTLTEENVRLKRQADERYNNVLALEEQIRFLKSSGEKNVSNKSELTRLNSALEVARLQQKEAEKMKGVSAEKELEIAELRLQMSELQKKSKQLEESRLQIVVLQKENAEKTLLLQNRDNSTLRMPRPVLVPSF